MVLKLYGVPQSVCTRRVAVVCREKNVPYELVPVDVAKRAHKSPAYLEKQPFGQLPYIDDDGFILYESRAIGRYIAAKYAGQGTPLLPADPKAHALFEQAASVEYSDFDPFVGGLALEKAYKKMWGQETDAARVQEYLKVLDGKLDAYEAILSKQAYLAGNEITLADIFHLPYGSMLSKIGIDALESEARPNVARWWKDISSRPSWQAVKEGA
ncbi:hypothetical protein PLICRDRAFT_166954 [Plicaturopsis crispa FD-325 SS-3]|uniref:glutathione transferase n=1 Tax=Plicaturopsis crispa FD-325 SS-3 TaxID=944288 RepID=A0A0C9T7H9_PLICR|nr:hypothetical protein PLICRDRAFT_166954 [Plicaturopsis crispa FD-325 SS-3]